MTPQEAGEWGRLIATFSGLAAGVLVWLRGFLGRRRQRRAFEQELRDAQAELLCVIADRDRVELAQFLDHRFSPQEHRDRLAVIRDRLLKARKRYWAALGFPESVDDAAQQRLQILRELRMTQRWKMRDSGTEGK